jgi:hypothetical protein
MLGHEERRRKGDGAAKRRVSRDWDWMLLLSRRVFELAIHSFSLR